jgi:hypothetical protein
MTEGPHGGNKRSELEFILLCLRARWDSAALEHARTLATQEGFDWGTVRRIAYRQGVAALIHSATRERELLPAALDKDLRSAYYYLARSNVRLFERLEKVLRCLAADGLPVVLLKGAALSAAVYGNAAVRPMGDLDLLVRQRDTTRILRALARLGYAPAHRELRPGFSSDFTNELVLEQPDQARSLASGRDASTQPLPGGKDGSTQPLPAGKDGSTQPLQAGKDGSTQPLPGGKDASTQPLPGGKDASTQPLPGGKDASTQPVELHWSAFDSAYYRYSVSMDWFWQTTLPAIVGETPAMVLGPEAQVLQLCAHITHHGGWRHAGLVYLHDVAEVIAQYRECLDWSELLKRCQEYRLVLTVRQILDRISRYWSGLIPVAVIDQFNAVRPSSEELRVVTWQTGTRRPALDFPSTLRYIPTWRQRLRFAWAVLFPSPAFMQYRYRIAHPLLLPLFYAYRLLGSGRVVS